MEEKIKEIVESSRHIVVIQADNPDADSLGSALALESILGDSGKDVTLYCAVDMPTYLRYLSGWDRIVTELPNNFDASIIVDASTLTLLERLQESRQINRLSTKSCIVLDHHETVNNPIDFAAATICEPGMSSTGELIFHLAQKLDWQISREAGDFIMTAILGDTQGLTNDLASPTTYRVMADLSDLGVSRPLLEEKRREYGKMSREILKYKAQLIEQTQFAGDGKIAYVIIPQADINKYSPLYNPVALIQPELLQTSGVAIGIVIKNYDDGRITGAIRANIGFPVAAKLAEKLGGGGHTYASGFKVTDGRSFAEVKSECISFAEELLSDLQKEITSETL